MKFKIFVLTAILALGIAGLNIQSVNAQFVGPVPSPKITFGEGNYINPWANLTMWSGYTYLSKDAYDGKDSKKNTFVGNLVPAFSGVGIDMKIQKLYVNSRVGVSYSNYVRNTASFLDLSAEYRVTDDFKIGLGENGSGWCPSPGPTPQLATVFGEALADYTMGFGPGSQYIGVAFKNIYVSVYNSIGPGKSDPSGTTYDTDAPVSNITTKVPRFQIGYSTPFPMTVGANYIYQKIKGDVGEGHSTSTFFGKTLETWGVQAYFDHPFIGPLSLHAIVFYGKNLGDAVLAPPPMPDTINPDFTAGNNSAGKWSDNKGYGGNFAFGYKIGIFQPSAGCGYRTSKREGDAKWDPEWTAYVSCGIRIADAPMNFTIYPGVQYTDQMKGYTVGPMSRDYRKQGHIIWAGILWQVII